jgi:transcription elongation factor Elf1
MKKPDRIAKVLQDELIVRNKSYFALSQATRILKEHGILSQSDISNGYLKSILEKGMITQATKTSRKPRQWRIHKEREKINIKQSKKKISSAHSKKKINIQTDTKIGGEKTSGEKKIKSLINTERTHRKNEEQLYFTCPFCGVNISVPEKYRKHDELKCFNCHRTFNNPIFHPNDKTVYEKISLQQKHNYSASNGTKKHLPIGTQIFRGLLAGLIIWASIKACTETPEEAMKQYQKEQKSIREHEKKKKETKEYFEFMGGQE